MHWHLLILTVLSLLLSATLSDAQILAEPDTDGFVRYGEPVVGEFKAGAIITASRGACKNIKAMVAIPFECAEQQVTIAQEDFSSDVEKVIYRDLQGGARQMLISVPYLARGAKARAVVTFQVATRPILPLEEAETAKLSIPRRPPREVRRFTSVSPYIESKDRRVRKIAREVFKEAPEDATDWRKVEMLYDYMLDNIEYIEGPDTSAKETLKAGSADCHGRSAVFIALCRASGVPARVVWVNNHCYPEFYMQDEEGEGHWFPVESAGSRAFGEMPLARVILQKGDNFRVPERPKDRLRYASDFLVGLPLPGGGPPKVKYIREQL